MIDFSKLNIAKTGLEKIKKEEDYRYELIVKKIFGDRLLVKVIDVVDGGETFRVETNPEKKDYWIKRCKKEYRPIKYDAQGNKKL